MRAKALIAILSFCVGYVFGVVSANAQAGQLPPGEQCFQTATGPVSSGSMNLYYPGTTTPKTSWTNSSESAANTQPIQLDANGCAIIWGVGTYRQQLYTGPVVGGLTTGTLIFDLNTVSLPGTGSSWYWAGQASGTANAIQLTDAGWSPVSGSNIQFVPVASNTGPVTLSPNTGVTPINVYVDSSAGPVPLAGGELATNNVANIVYDATLGIFHLQNPLSTASANSGFPIGGEISCRGFNAPTGFLFEYGQAISRTTYASLLATLTSTQNGTLNATTSVTGLNDTSQLAVGMEVEGANIPGSTTIATIVSSTAITLSSAATGSGTSSITFYAYGNGDGSTTFNLPDMRGRLAYGRDNMGGTAASNLTTAYATNNPDALGQLMTPPHGTSGGGYTFQRANLPNFNLPVTDPGHTHPLSATINLASGSGSGGGSYYTGNGGTALTVQSATTGISVGSGGSGTAMSLVNKGLTTNMCIRAQ